MTNKMGGELVLESAQIAGSHAPELVVLSYFVAALAAYTTLDLIATIKADPELETPSVRRFMWQFGAAVALGGGVWAMHFIGLLSLSFGEAVYVGYASSFVGVSLLVTVVFAYFAIWLLTHQSNRKRYLFAGGALAGVSIAV